MSTTTARLGLYKPASDGSENYNVVTDQNNNWDKLDADVGVIQCTSGTRPGTPFNGMLIRETDTGNMLVCTNITGPVWTQVLIAGQASWPESILVIRAAATDTAFRARLAGDTQSRFLVQADGKVLWGAGSAVGDVNITRSAAGKLTLGGSLEMAGTLDVVGVVTISGDAVINTKSVSARPLGIVRRYRRTTVSSASTSATLVGVLMTEDLSIVSGRLYRIGYQIHFDSTVADDQCRAELRHTTDGATPTTASAVLVGSGSEAVIRTTGTRETRNAETYYAPGVDQTLSLLLAVSRQAGSGNVTAFADASQFVTEIWVEDMGTDPGSSGSDI